MIISQTPLRISFFGGGTDLSDFYTKYNGMVLSSTIDKYIYVIVKSRYDNNIILNYSKKEECNCVDEIEHPIIRECLRLVGIENSIEITSIADIPSSGSGLGSSSSFTVGLLNALYTYIGQSKNSIELAELACKIEIDILGEPIGKQDQYAAAVGGFKQYIFNNDHSVDIKDLNVSSSLYHQLNLSTVLIYTGITRKTGSILKEQNKNTTANIESLLKLVDYVKKGKEYFSLKDIKSIGELLDDNWKEKQKLAKSINTPEISSLYDTAKECGIWGGKLLGAGGGGFFLFMCSFDNQNRLREELSDYQELPFSFDPYGTRIIMNLGNNLSFINN